MAFAPLLNDRSRAWNGTAAVDALRTFASSDGSGDKDKMDWGKYAEGFMYHADSPSDFGDFKLPYCDVEDGKLVAIWKGVTTCAAVLQGSMGGVHIPQSSEAHARSIVNHYYAEARKMFDDDAITPPWQQKNAMAEFEARFGAFGGVETRIIPIEVRAEDNGDPNSPFSIQGHASVFGRPSLDLGGFTEYIDARAFERVLENNPDVVLNWDHDNRWPLARTTSDAYRLYLDSDPVGLAYWGRVAPTSYAGDLRILMESGLVNQASFAFTVAKDEWRIRTDGEGNETVERTILEVGDLFDVCVTAQGAYPNATSEIARSYFREEAEKRNAQWIEKNVVVDNEDAEDEIDADDEVTAEAEAAAARARKAKAVRVRAKKYTVAS